MNPFRLQIPADEPVRRITFKVETKHASRFRPDRAIGDDNAARQDKRQTCRDKSPARCKRVVFSCGSHKHPVTNFFAEPTHKLAGLLV